MSKQEQDRLIEELKKQTAEFERKHASTHKLIQETDELLHSVINNIDSAIIATSVKKSVFLKNKLAMQMIDKYSEDRLFDILRRYTQEGVYDFELDNSSFHLNISSIKTDDNLVYVYVIKDTTKLKKLEEDRLRNEKLQLMGEMVANITHEIRNPLGSIELFSSLLARDLENDSDKKRLAFSIIKGVRNINALISNTLLFTKEIKVDKNEFILSDLVDEVVLYLQHIIRDRSIKFINKLDINHKVYCDSDMYKQVVMNIISNACDAVEDKVGRIEAISYERDSMLYLSISDNGSGISKEMLPKLFMPFQTTKAKGTGLGLSIAYKIIKSHNGDITVKSDEDVIDNRTIFTIITPNVL